MRSWLPRGLGNSETANSESVKEAAGRTACQADPLACAVASQTSEMAAEMGMEESEVWEKRRRGFGRSCGEVLKKLRGVIVTIPPARSLFPLRDAETLLAASSSGHAQDDDSSNATLYFGHAERHIAPCLPSRLHDVAKHTMSGPRRPQMFVASTSHFLLPSRIAGVGWLFHIKPPAGVPVHAESVYLLRIVLSATMPVSSRP